MKTYNRSKKRSMLGSNLKIVSILPVILIVGVGFIVIRNITNPESAWPPYDVTEETQGYEQS